MARADASANAERRACGEARMNIPLTPIRFLRYARKQFANKVGVVCGDHRFTYAQFAEQTARLAGAFIAAGAKPGDRVAFLSTNCHRLLEAYYGVLQAGCILLPLNIRFGSQELSFVLNDAQARFLFVESPFLPLAEPLRSNCPSIEACFVLDGRPEADWLVRLSYDELLADSKPFECDFTKVDENSVAELFYTSGTSARPKGVALTHRNVYLHALSVIAAAQTAATKFGQTSSESVLLHTIPLFHANGWGAAHVITVVGGRHVMIHHFNPVEVLRLIERERVTGCSMVPAMITALLHCPEREKRDLSSLQAILVGGSASSPTLVKEVEEKMGCACISGYGLTETSPILAVSSMKRGVDWQGDQRYAGQAMTGFAIPGVELRVVGPDGQDVPPGGGAIGEVLTRGDAVMQGYWRQPEATREAMEGGWFHTGDIATIDRDNYIHIVDRRKDIIVSGGENISSLEVERVLLSHPAVYETAVIPIPDKRWGEVPKALVVLKPKTQASEDELVQFCRSRLAHYKCPHSVEFVQALPRSGTGKVLKRELRQRYATADTSAGS
jgi:acyl-CoA synthetase (AMP-forming)/AMP-acid ligase II